MSTLKYDECFAAAMRRAEAPNASGTGKPAKEKKEKKAVGEGKKVAEGKMSKEEKMAMWGGGKKDAKKEEKMEKKPEEKKEVFVNKTPEGEKKNLSEPMSATYDPLAVESAWNAWWEKQGYYTPDVEKAKTMPQDKKFVMVIPPPNVTGSLHVGHALTAAIEDSLTRWHRMQGHATLWVPGVDHAGIATQSVVERLMYKNENKTRHDLGREKFLERVWGWKHEYGDRICKQFRLLGVSVDWTRLRFTMDDMCNDAVKASFVKFFDEGRIFRAARIVNWSCYLNTGLSDLEVDYKDIEKRTLITIPGFDGKVEVGVINHFKYKVKGEDSYVTVATTRTETMLGDVAVAVHPEDTRYASIVGKQLEHPFCPDRVMTVIRDTYVDKDFGTGCVKITPGHDPNDFQMGKRHDLETINVLNDNGTMNHLCGEFAGQHRFEARRTVEEALKKKGLWVEKKDHNLRLGLCSRSGDIIEPLTRPQWWMKCDDLAKKSVEAVRNQELKIVPSFHEHTWFHWLENIQDWCISRQLWWGHRIPAYKVIKPDQGGKELWIAASSNEEAYEKARKQLGVKDVELKQDEDVLDTWYSSGLFPFSVMGWPNKTDDMEAFFPGSLLETGHDILFFWVARMVMMSIGILDKLPFNTVYLHPMVRDAMGRKMSKSLGNTLDPLELIYGCQLEALHAKLNEGNLPPAEVVKAKANQKKEFPNGIPECGADALRYGLLAYTAQGRSVNLDVSRVAGYRRFCNKLWNMMKFSLENFPEGFVAKGVRGRKLSFEDEWILSQLNTATEKCNKGFNEWMFADVVSATYDFWFNNLAAVYLELLKPRLQGENVSEEDKTTAREVLYTCFDRGLRLLHPVLPFISEELYQRLPHTAGKAESIVIAPYPLEVIAWKNLQVDELMDLANEVIHGYRAQMSALEILPKMNPKAYVRFSSDVTDRILPCIQILAKVADLTRLPNNETSTPPGCLMDVVNEQCTIFLEVKSLVDVEKQKGKMIKKIEEAKKSIASYEKKMEDPDYLTRVPEDVRELNSTKLEASKTQLAELTKGLKGLEEL